MLPARSNTLLNEESSHMLEKSTLAQKEQIVVDEKEGHLAELDTSNFLTCECPQLEAASSKELVLIIVELRDKPSTLSQFFSGGRTGLVVRALDSGSGDPGSILGRVGVLFP